jgi:hypothetical protein
VAAYFYQNEANTRFYWYPETYLPRYPFWKHWTPTLWLDGVQDVMESDTIAHTWSVYRGEIEARLAIPSPVEMDIQVFYGAKSDTGTVHVEVVATDPISFTNLHLNLAIIESNLSYSGSNFNQVLRDYFPSTTGVSFSIAQGDTFTHSEDFVIQGAWDEEECDIVAFVQDRTTRDVLQSIKSPVISIPALVSELTSTRVEDNIRLNWAEVTMDTRGNPLTVDHYNIYRDTVGFFDPGSDPFASINDIFYLDNTGVVGNPATQYFYWITAVAGYKESGGSAGVGEFDRDLITGK